MHLVKRKGHKQEFDERKTYASVYAACLACHLSSEEAETIANLLTREIKKWISKKDLVNSDELFKQISEELMILNKEVAFIYTTHRDIT